MFTDREKDVLKAIVHSYVVSAEPVASKTLVEHYGLKVSSATVRNIMNILEKQGYITQLHTSSGRVPTDLGYNYYIDHLMNEHVISQEENQRIQKDYFDQSSDLKALTSQAIRALAQLTDYTSLVALPSLQRDAIHSIRLVRVDKERLVVVVFFKNGLTKERVILVREKLSDQELKVLAACLNSLAKGRSEEQVKQALLANSESIDAFKLYDLIRELASFNLFDFGRREIMLEGRCNMASHPEFRDPQKLTNFLQLLDEKSSLERLLCGQDLHDGVKVFMGDLGELSESLEDCSVVATNYRIGSEVSGSLGLIGPKRMRYSEAISSVQYIAQVLSQSLTELFQSKGYRSV